MAEVLLFTSSKDSCGIGVLDVATGSNVGSSFKNCIADAGVMCTIGSSESSYSGRGSGGDFIAVSQSKKPLIHVWQWGKPQPVFQSHVQEIITALGSDSTGTYLVGGTQKGWIHIWNTATGELINMWQAHLKDVCRIYVTKNNQFIVSASVDGVTRVWETSKVLDVSERLKTGVIKSNILPYRSWCQHTLGVKDMYVLDSLGVLRVFTVGVDKNLILYDVFASTVVLQTSFPHSLESVTCSPGLDVVCLGATNGSIYVVDLTALSIGVTAAHSKIAVMGLNSAAGKKAVVPIMFQTAAMAHTASTTTRPELQSLTSGGMPKGTSILEGHTKAVTALCFSVDNSTLVSASEDGTLRWWNVWTRQCTRENTPPNKCGITNALIVNKPELLNTGLVKPYLCPLYHLRKYMEQPSTYPTDANGRPCMVLGSSLMSNYNPLRSGNVSVTSEQYCELKRVCKGIRQSVEEADNAVANAAAEEIEQAEPVSKRQKNASSSSSSSTKKKSGSAGGDLGDFVSFSSSADDVNQQNEEDKDEQISELQMQLQLAEEKVALLEEQNSRWEEICKQLKNHISNEGDDEEGSNDEEEEEDDSEEAENEDESEEEVVVEVASAKRQKKGAAAAVASAPKAAPVAATPAPKENSRKRKK